MLVPLALPGHAGVHLEDGRSSVSQLSYQTEVGACISAGLINDCSR
jgi:hypothetical protein